MPLRNKETEIERSTENGMEIIRCDDDVVAVQSGMGSGIFGAPAMETSGRNGTAFGICRVLHAGRRN